MKKFVRVSGRSSRFEFKAFCFTLLIVMNSLITANIYKLHVHDSDMAMATNERNDEEKLCFTSTSNIKKSIDEHTKKMNKPPAVKKTRKKYSLIGAK